MLGFGGFGCGFGWFGVGWGFLRFAGPSFSLLSLVRCRPARFSPSYLRVPVVPALPCLGFGGVWVFGLGCLLVFGSGFGLVAGGYHGYLNHFIAAVNRGLPRICGCLTFNLRRTFLPPCQGAGLGLCAF